jgi:hypothetical protein
MGDDTVLPKGGRVDPGGHPPPRSSVTQLMGPQPHPHTSDGARPDSLDDEAAEAQGLDALEQIHIEL